MAAAPYPIIGAATEPCAGHEAAAAAELLLKNVFFDTCVYHQKGVDLLTSVVPVENVLFASRDGPAR